MEIGMRSWIAYLLVASTVLLTVAGQFIVKWQVLRAGHIPDGPQAQLEFMLSLLSKPWILSAFLLAFIASVTWMLAMTKLDLSHAYPMTALTFVLVVVGSSLLFAEPVTTPKLAGLALVVLGIVVGSQG